MKPKPTHQDIDKYGYFMQYSKSKDNWYAAYDTDCKGAVWYAWNGKGFDSIEYNRLPHDLA